MWRFTRYLRVLFKSVIVEAYHVIIPMCESHIVVDALTHLTLTWGDSLFFT